MEKSGTVKIISTLLLIFLCLSFTFAANSTTNETINSAVEDSVANITTEETAAVTENVTEEVAVEGVVSTTDPILLASYNTVKCKTNFAIALVGTIMASDSFAIYLADSASTLQKDLEKLKEFVDNNDKEGYSAYLKGTYESDLNRANESIGEWKETGFRLISSQSKSGLKGNYAVLDAKYKICLLDYIRTFGNGRVTSFNSILTDYQKKADALKDKGVATESLDKVIADAKTQVVEPMLKIVVSSNEAKSVNQAVKAYCLFDGCKEGINYHLAEKWEVTKLKLMLERMNSSDQDGVETTIADLEMNIYTAESAMTYAGSNQFTEEQQKQIDDSIKAGYDLIKQIINNK